MLKNPNRNLFKIRGSKNWGFEYMIDYKRTRVTTKTPDIKEARKIRDKWLEQVNQRRQRPKYYKHKQVGHELLNRGLAGLLDAYGLKNLDGFKDMK